MSSTVKGQRGGDGLDFFATPAWCTKAILSKFRPFGPAFDPFAGVGSILDVVEDEWDTCVTSGYEIDPDRHAIGNKRHNLDTGPRCAFETNWDAGGLLITNPPFSHAQQCLEKAVASDNIASVILLRLSVLEGIKRSSFWKKNPCDVYVLSKRPSFNGKGTDSCAYAWFVFSRLSRGGHWEVL